MDAKHYKVKYSIYTEFSPSCQTMWNKNNTFNLTLSDSKIKWVYSLSRNTCLITPEQDKGPTNGFSFRGDLDPKKVIGGKSERNWFLTFI